MLVVQRMPVEVSVHDDVELGWGAGLGVLGAVSRCSPNPPPAFLRALGLHPRIPLPPSSSATPTDSTLRDLAPSDRQSPRHHLLSLHRFAPNVGRINRGHAPQVKRFERQLYGTKETRANRKGHRVSPRRINGACFHSFPSFFFLALF
ncbi:hypothetical protein SKAU_G00384340 [Synaphobranchus kaupii]|uniref:Uncharacterized protein n=1 Tax=Synaphobranchus kaupii TaxID=118154 RepID=A0A9Q1IF00_SYNKA|nr:hypothetical protein SKAU_G00384340 [Synaphobranchus kaupii]